MVPTPHHFNSIQQAGKGRGGDCDHLLLASSATKYIELRAHGGEILIEDTHVESWDLSAGTVDEDDEDGRRCALACLLCLIAYLLDCLLACCFLLVASLFVVVVAEGARFACLCVCVCAWPVCAVGWVFLWRGGRGRSWLGWLVGCLVGWLVARCFVLLLVCCFSASLLVRTYVRKWPNMACFLALICCYMRY